MKRLFIFIFLLVVFISILGNAGAEELKTPETAADFELSDLRGNNFVLSKYKGKHPVVLFFWTTWCPHCRQELKTLNNLYSGLISSGWQVFAISVNESSEKVDNFVKRQGLSFKVLLDNHAKVADAFDVLGVPTYVVINKKGQIVFKGHYFPIDEYKGLTG